MVIAAAVVFDRSFDRWGILLAQRVFPAPRTRVKTVAVLGAAGVRRRVRYLRRRPAERQARRRGG
jgi:hypothetical protein